MSNEKDRTRIVGGADPDDPSFMDDIMTFVTAGADRQVAARLEIVEGPGKGEILEVLAGPNPVGRQEDGNSIVLDFGDKTISRVAHAIIVAAGTPAAFTLHDGGKTNPVKLNGTPIGKQASAQIGDTIEIGVTTLRILDAG